MTTDARLTIGVDIGTGSVRAGIFDQTGALLAADEAGIAIHQEGDGIVEQSSAEIWSAACAAVREAVARANVSPGEIAGIAFDATCSLVVVGEGGAPLPVGDPVAPERDVIVWMDHRARAQADRINGLHHDVLRYVGDRISPEMQTPKLLWLKENRPDVFDRAWQFFDLTDYLGWRATGSLARSVCTVTCKWTYLAHERRWDESYFRQIGLGALADEAFARIGTEIVDAGTPLAGGLTDIAARDLGLRPGTAVGAGLIDAHAGGIGTVGADGDPEADLAYVFGTSSCTMTTTREPVFVPGVWGPYYSAMVPGLWLNEGGQSAAGAAIAHLLEHHPFTPEAHGLASAAGRSLPDWLAEEALRRVVEPGEAISLAAGLHVVPEFMGNRAPFADPQTRAVIAGLSMRGDLDSLLELYVAGLCGVGYGLRQIIDAQSEKGVTVDRVVLSGGAGRSPLVRQILADAADMRIALPVSDQPVLLGSAIIGAVASGLCSGIVEGMARMTGIGETVVPAADRRGLHARRYELFGRFQAVARDAARIETI